jgi:hypothetical protein
MVTSVNHEYICQSCLHLSTMIASVNHDYVCQSWLDLSIMITSVNHSYICQTQFMCSCLYSLNNPDASIHSMLYVNISTHSINIIIFVTLYSARCIPLCLLRYENVVLTTTSVIFIFICQFMMTILYFIYCMKIFLKFKQFKDFKKCIKIM